MKDKFSIPYLEKELRKLQIREATATNEVKRAEIRKQIAKCNGLLEVCRKMDAPIQYIDGGKLSVRGNPE